MRILLAAALAVVVEIIFCVAYASRHRRPPLWTCLFSGVASACASVAFFYRELNNLDSDGALFGQLMLHVLLLGQSNMSPVIPLVFLIWTIFGVLAALLSWVPFSKQNA